MIESRKLKQVKQFRYLGIAEAISFIILLGVAMPLKYVYNLPQAVQMFGWVHGLLFMAYLFQLFYLSRELKWSFGRIGLYFVAALLPLAPFYVEKKLKEEYK